MQVRQLFFLSNVNFSTVELSRIFDGDIHFVTSILKNKQAGPGSAQPGMPGALIIQ